MRTKSFIASSLLLFVTVAMCSTLSAARGQATNQRGLSVRVKAPNGTEIELYGESHALVIGVSKYGGGAIRDLPGVERDLPEVRAVLENHGFQVKVLLNPTRRMMDEEINAFIDNFGQSPANRLLIYFAGHGSTQRLSDGREMGYILPADVLPTSDAQAFKRIAISMDAIEGYARRIESKHALFVFDSCFSGALFEALRPGAVPPPLISDKTALPVRQFITAGTADQFVQDKSIFRAEFVAGLNGAADLNSDGYVTVTELAMFVEDKVANYSRRTQTPRYGKIRDPKLDQGDMVFVLPRKPDNARASLQETSLSQAPVAPATETEAVRQPEIRITTVPAYDPRGGSVALEPIAGAVFGVNDPTSYRVVIYALTNHWWVQPLANAPFTEIDSRGKWNTQSHLGAQYAALLVKTSFKPPSECEVLPPVGGNVVASAIVTGRKK